jgi:hypothetical protein
MRCGVRAFARKRGMRNITHVTLAKPSIKVFGGN